MSQQDNKPFQWDDAKVIEFFEKEITERLKWGLTHDLAAAPPPIQLSIESFKSSFSSSEKVDWRKGAEILDSITGMVYTSEGNGKWRLSSNSPVFTINNSEIGLHCHHRYSPVSTAPIPEEKPSVKPPIGIIPEWLWKEQRIKELKAAISRYVNYDPAKIDTAWITELSALEEWHKKWEADIEQKSKIKGGEGI